MRLKLALKKCTEYFPWSIHGLWIDNDNGTWPSYCSKMPFEPIPGDVLVGMNNMWYSCDGDNHSFWEHELEKHDSCIQEYITPTLTSTIFFNATLMLFEGFLPYIDYYCVRGLECFIKYLRNPDAVQGHN